MQEYKPLLELFFRTIQNKTVIFQGNIVNGFSVENQFHTKLLMKINNRSVPNTIRMFEHNNEVYLVYYWLSSLKDEFGRNIGNTPILGVSCTKKRFMANPDMLALKLQNFFISIVEETFVTNTEDAYEAADFFFDGIELNYHLKNILLNYDGSTNKLVNKDLLAFVRKQKLSLFSKIDVDEEITLTSPFKELNKRKIK